MKYEFIKENEGDQVWWLDNYDAVGEYVFSFNRKKRYNLFRDYPDKLSVREWITFNGENPYWAKFFADRNEIYELEHIEEIIKEPGGMDWRKGEAE